VVPDGAACQAAAQSVPALVVPGPGRRDVVAPALRADAGGCRGAVLLHPHRGCLGVRQVVTGSGRADEISPPCGPMHGAALVQFSCVWTGRAGACAAASMLQPVLTSSTKSAARYGIASILREERFDSVSNLHAGRMVSNRAALNAWLTDPQAGLIRLERTTS
jgi:hypothetical protein